MANTLHARTKLTTGGRSFDIVGQNENGVPLVLCPYCGQSVYGSHIGRHADRCKTLIDHYGGTEALRDYYLTERPGVKRLTREIAGVSETTATYVLLSLGIAQEMLDEDMKRGRPQGYSPGPAVQAGTRQCARCAILMDHPDTPAPLFDPDLCGWCEGTTPATAVPKDPGAVAFNPLTVAL